MEEAVEVIEATITNVPALTRDLNWVVHEGKKQLVYRVIGYKVRTVILMLIGHIIDGEFVLLSPPNNSSNRVFFTPQHVRALFRQGRIRGEPEMGIPQVMQDPDGVQYYDEILKHKRKALDVFALYGDEILWNKKIYAEAVSVALNAADASAPTVRKWFEQHLFYGGHPCALIPHHWNMGGPGILRRGQRTFTGELNRDVGRPTDSEALNPETPVKKKTFTTKVLTEFSRFVWKMAWETELNFNEICKEWLHTRIAFNQQGGYSVDPKYAPSLSNLIRVATPIIKESRNFRQQSRLNSVGFKRALAGGELTQLVNGELCVYDLDATSPDFWVLIGDRKTPTKLVFVFAFCRGSGAIVGWDISLQRENTDSYLRCLYNAFTPKNEILKKYGVEHLTGFVFGSAAKVFVDRGPCVSDKAAKIISSGIRTDLLMARPGDPPAKGGVEQIMSNIQKKLVNLPGSSHPTGNAEVDRKRRLRVKKEACLTMDELMPILLGRISEYNMSTNVTDLLDNGLQEDGVPGTPKEIYEHLKLNRGGDFSYDWPASQLYTAFCVKHKKLVRNGFVHINKKKYSSPDLVKYARDYRHKNNKNPTVTVYEAPESEFRVYWQHSETVFSDLHASDKTVHSYVDDDAHAARYRNQQKNANYQEIQYKNRKDALEMKKITEKFISQARQKKVEAMEKNAGEYSPPVPHKVAVVQERARMEDEAPKPLLQGQKGNNKSEKVEKPTSPSGLDGFKFNNFKVPFKIS